MADILRYNKNTQNNDSQNNNTQNNNAQNNNTQNNNTPNNDTQHIDICQKTLTIIPLGITIKRSHIQHDNK